jgi:hypothetical protein
MLTKHCLEWAGRMRLKILKEIQMQNRKCSKCGSLNVYKNTSDNWHQNGVVVKMISVDNFPDLFQTEAFICLDCRNLEIQVLATSTAYGKHKDLVESVQASNNWKKV